MFIRTFALSLIIFGANSLLAAPSGGRVTAGDGEIANPLNIIQHSEHLGTSWESFDIASGEVVSITQPSASALISIKVRNGTETNINGTLNANGKVALENPAGVLFGAGSVVNVGGLLATASAGAVQADGVINAPLGEVHLQSLADNNVVNVGGTIEAQRIIVEGANEVKLGASAVLTAAKEVLVGGGFQGKGEIANSQKTIVESGALITAPRVIIWSDVSTNFQGSINAEGGFVEVSGKQSLASFDIFKVKAAELLLDPPDITIVQALAAPADSQIANDGIVEEDDSGSSFLLSNKAVEDFDGDVSLAATNGIAINVDAPINKTNGGLTLTAPFVSIRANVMVSGDLIVTATQRVQFSIVHGVVLSGRTVSVIGNVIPHAKTDNNVTITSTGAVTLGGIIAVGTGNITVTGSPINFSTTTPTMLIGGGVTLNIEGGTPTASNQDLTFNLAESGAITLTGTSLNLGTGNLIFGGENFPASKPTGFDGVTRGGLGVFYDGSDDFDFSTIPSWLTDAALAGENFSVVAVTANIAVPTAFALGTSTLTLNAQAGALLFDGDAPTTLSAGKINLTSTVAQTTASDQNLSITATGRLIMNGDYNIGTGNAALTFGGDFRETPEPTSLLTDDLTLTHTGPNALEVADWMQAPSRNLSIIFEQGAVQGLENLNLGDDTDDSITRGNLIVRAKVISIAGGANIYTVKANNINLTLSREGDSSGGIESIEGSLVLDAKGNITIDVNTIHLLQNADPDLTLIAGGEIVFVRNTTILAQNITLNSSTIKAESTAGDTTTQHNLSLNANAKLTFSNSEATTITAADITLISPTAADASGQDLTLTAAGIASGIITLDGAFDVGAGNMVFTSGADQPINFSTSRATTLTAANITLTSSGGTPTASNQALTLTASGAATGTITLGGAFDTGTGDIMMTSGTSAPINFSTTLATSLAGAAITLISSGGTPTASNQDLTLTASGALKTDGIIVTADNIILTATSIISSASTTATFNASSNITFNSPSLDLDGSLVLNVSGEILFTESVVITAPSITLNSSTVKAQAISDSSNVPISITGVILFSSTEATTLIGSDVSLCFTDTNIVNNQSLSVKASGNLTIKGNLNIGTGAMRLIAGEGNGTGTIMFSNTPTLTASAITLIQNGAPFPAEQPEVVFSISGGGQPGVRYSGLENQVDITWATLAGIITSPNNINLGTLLEVGNALEGENENPDPTNKPNDVILDLTDNDSEDERNFIVSSEQNLVLPDGEVVIKAEIILITAKTIRNADGTGITKPLTLEATQSVTINADIASTSNIIIKAPQVIFSVLKPVRLSGANITIDVPDGMDMPNDMPTANNQNVMLTATSSNGNITLDNNINLGFGTLTLAAGGRIKAANRDVTIMANRVEYQPGSNDNTVDFSITIISINDIELLGNLGTNASITLRAGGSIITPNANTIVQTAGPNITWEQKYPLRQNYPITLKSARTITISGTLDRGTANITLDSPALNLSEALLIAGGINCPSVSASTPLC